MWGVFEVECRLVRNGVRYALTSRPNAFQWTITSRHGETVVHGSINQMSPDPEFAESIEEFLHHFCSRLEQQTHPQLNQQPAITNAIPSNLQPAKPSRQNDS